MGFTKESLLKAIEKEAGLTATAVDHYFSWQDPDDKQWFFLRLRGTHLEYNMHQALKKLATKCGGAYYWENKEFQFPKERNDDEPADDGYDLKQSSEGWMGQLYPVLLDAHDNVIDGFHRREVNPQWRTQKLSQIDTTVKLEIARLAANFNRRIVPREELEQKIGFLIGAGLKPKEIAQQTGISLRTVYRYMPEGAKDKAKAEAGKVKSDVVRDVVTAVTTKPKTQDTVLETPSMQSMQQQMMSQIIECEGCHKPVHRSRLAIKGGLLLCPECRGEKPKPLRKTKPTEYKPKEKPEFVVGRMKTEVSEMDRYIYEKAMQDPDLRERGFKVTFQKVYVLTKSDVTIEKPGLEFVVFNDNVETHKNRQGRDEVITSVLMWQESIQKGGVIRAPYEGGFSKAKGEQVWNKIKEALS